MSALTRAFPGVPGSVRYARELVGSVLAAAGCPARDDVVLCVSELVTNAVQHSQSAGPAGLIRLRLEVTPGEWVQVSVQDEGPALGLPPSGEPPSDGLPESGWGLLIVALLADLYGTDGLGLYWCRLAWGKAEAERGETP